MKGSGCGHWSFKPKRTWRGARLDKRLFDKRFLDGADLWWLDQRGITFMVPTKDHMAVTADARAPVAAEDEITVGRRVHTVRHG